MVIKLPRSRESTPVAVTPPSTIPLIRRQGKMWGFSQPAVKAPEKGVSSLKGSAKWEK